MKGNPQWKVLFTEREAEGGFTQHAGKAHYPDVLQWGMSNIGADVGLNFVNTRMKEVLAGVFVFHLASVPQR